MMALRSSCLALGREGDLQRVSAYLDEEWLRSTADLAGLSEAGWLELRLPIGLKEELKRLLPMRLGASDRRPPAAAWPDVRQRSAEEDGMGLPRRQRPGADRRFVSDRSASRLSVEESDSSFSGNEGAFRPEVLTVLDRLRAEIKRRGSNTLAGLARRFRIMDNDHSQSLNLEEFVSGLGDLQLGVSKAELDMLWQEFDADGSGLVTFNEVVALLGGGLNVRRRHALRVLFGILDVNGNRWLQLNDLQMRYDPSVLGEPHSKLARTRPPDEVLVDFLTSLKEQMDVPEAVKGITLRDFERYYDKISASIDSDEYFEEVLRRAWGLPEGWIRAAGSSNKRRQRPAPSRPPPCSGSGILEKVRQALSRDVPYGQRIAEANKPVSDRWSGALLVARAAAKFRHAGRSAQGTAAGVAVPEAPVSVPALPRSEFESLLRRLCPELAASELAVLCALFRSAVGDAGSGVDYARFLQALRQQAALEGHRAAASRVFEELAGSGARELDLAKFGRRVPPAVREFFGEGARVRRDDWQAFHDTAAAAAIAASSGPEAFESDLQRAWSLQSGGRSRSQPAQHKVTGSNMSLSGLEAPRPRPAYYKGISSIQLG